MELKKLDKLEKLAKSLNKKERSAAQVVVEDVVAVKKGERVLIIANPATNPVAQEFYLAASDAGAIPTLIFQNDKTSFDNANPEVIAAIKTEPEVCFSISNVKLGKDAEAQANPYVAEDGQTYPHIFDYLLDGKKTMRGVWTPGITEDMLYRTANIDYAELKARCVALKELFTGATSVRVTAPGGTDVEIDIQNRELLFDDGDFTKPGTGGNIPAGEVFISPVVGKTNGTIVYDGSMTFSDGDALLEEPIVCKVENGFVTTITGDASAKRLLKTITDAETKPALMEKEKKLQKDQAPVYKRNARNIGELGIGLNPAAQITGNMLEDEKAFHTCHFAIGENYDNDAPALIHLDGVVREPTIVLNYADKESVTILENGNLIIK